MEKNILDIIENAAKDIIKDSGQKDYSRGDQLEGTIAMKNP